MSSVRATLVPETASAYARPASRLGRVGGYGLTFRALLLLLAGVVWAAPAFFHPRWIWAMVVWDGLVLALAAGEAYGLPAPGSLRVERSFSGPLSIAQETIVTVAVRHATARRVLEMRITDDLHPALLPMPSTQTVRAFPMEDAKTQWTVLPNQRGVFHLRPVFVHMCGALGLAERWALAELSQTVKVYAEMERGGEMALYLARIRQIEQQKRRLRLKGTGREFENLRDYQVGDEMRNISWTATARRGKLITRQFTTERSQQVWVVLDAGRLSRTSFQLRNRKSRSGQHGADIPSLWAYMQPGEDETVAGNIHITQLDQAAAAASALAQVVVQSGDKVGLLAYGRGIQQRVLPGAGYGHLRKIVEALAEVRPEPAEANHLQAALQLLRLQRRRGLVVWITEMGETAYRPETVDAAAELSRRHLVVLLLLRHPEMSALAEHRPGSVGEMFAGAAAREVVARSASQVARLRSAGVLALETTPAEVKASALNEYLAVKARGLL